MASVQAHEPQVDGLNVCWQPPDGKTMCFGWEGPFLVDGKPENWEDFPHYDNLYTHTPLDAEQMTINCGNDAITLDLQHGHVVPEKP